MAGRRNHVNRPAAVVLTAVGGRCERGYMKLAWHNRDRVSSELGGTLEVALHVNGGHIRTDRFWVS